MWISTGILFIELLFVIGFSISVGFVVEHVQRLSSSTLIREYRRIQDTKVMYTNWKGVIKIFQFVNQINIARTSKFSLK